jgi:hypothetical protein
MNKTITILGANQQPVTGASVFVGTSPASELGNGKYLAIFNVGASLLRVSAAGYADFRLTLSDVPPSVVSLTPLVVGTQQITLVCPPGGCFVNINGEQVPIDQNTQKGTTVGKLAPGSYPYTSIKDGYSNGSGTLVVVSAKSEYPVDPPKKIADSGTADTTPASNTASVIPPPTTASDSQGVTSIQQADLPVAAATQPATSDYEWIYPNTDDGKYFTTSQARLYVGNLFVDEMDSLQMALQANKIPVYGYSSEDFDAIGRGKRLVQGQLAVNFISEGYLFTVLSEFNRLLNAPPAPDPDQQLLQQLYATKNTLLTQAQTSIPQSGFGIGSDIPVSQDEVDTRLTLVQQQIDQLHAKLGKSSVDAVRVSLVGADKIKTTKNAVYTNVPFDIEFQFEGGGRTITRRIEKCVLTGNEQILDQSGLPVKDVYSFIARRMS